MESFPAARRGYSAFTAEGGWQSGTAIRCEYEAGLVNRRVWIYAHPAGSDGQHFEIIFLPVKRFAADDTNYRDLRAAIIELDEYCRSRYFGYVLYARLVPKDLYLGGYVWDELTEDYWHDSFVEYQEYLPATAGGEDAAQ